MNSRDSGTQHKYVIALMATKIKFSKPYFAFTLNDHFQFNLNSLSQHTESDNIPIKPLH